VAEDETLIRMDVVETLAEHGYDVVGEASDGQQAIDLTRSLGPDLVVMDVQMPVMDGITAAQTITDEGLAGVLILTAFSQRELVQRAAESGAMAYLVKPFEPDELIAALEVAAARRAQIVALESDVSDLAERLETRKAVERAKRQLMSAYGLTEPDAFRWIQKTAMDKRTGMRAVAELVLAETAEEPDGR
jgi:AmiR/NasT family two-component response regulator